MFSRRIVMATMLAVLTAVLTAAPVAAAKPARPPGQPASGQERPLTPEEEALSAARIAAADAYVASVQETDLVSLACVTPTGAEVDLMGDATTDDPAATIVSATIQGCYVPQGFLAVYARDQILGHYCGPAVGQVIANYSWAMSSTGNKYTQTTIAGWMATDANGGTSAYTMEAGLERATAGAPRRPANWNWVVTQLRDSDNDGTTGDQLHSYLRSNVSGSRMPLAIPVKPHQPGAQFHLSSWPKAISSPGHWIAAYGWVGNWTGTDYARLYYTDSSKDEGGSTGKFWDPTRHIAAMVMVHTARFVW